MRASLTRPCWSAKFLLLGLAALFANACSSEDLSPVPNSATDATVDTSLEAHNDTVGSEVKSEAAPDAVKAAGPEAGSEESSANDVVAETAEAAQDAGPCPEDMVLVGAACMDRYEAPNHVGEYPFVMFHFNEAESWCTARGKRLCFDDEWTAACEGPEEFKYPYGNTLDPGVCNDDKTYKAYNQELLNLWPWTLDTDPIESLDQLLEAVRAKGAGAKSAADHVQALYQGTAAGEKPGCVGAAGVGDLVGNVEEWARRRDGGEPSFHGSLKGRYWCEPRSCQQGVLVHGDTFRFYEIGFRCCRDL